MALCQEKRIPKLFAFLIPFCTLSDFLSRKCRIFNLHQSTVFVKIGSAVHA